VRVPRRRSSRSDVVTLGRAHGAEGSWPFESSAPRKSSTRSHIRADAFSKTERRLMSRRSGASATPQLLDAELGETPSGEVGARGAGSAPTASIDRGHRDAGREERGGLRWLFLLEASVRSLSGRVSIPREAGDLVQRRSAGSQQLLRPYWAGAGRIARYRARSGGGLRGCDSPPRSPGTGRRWVLGCRSGGCA